MEEEKHEPTIILETTFVRCCHLILTHSPTQHEVFFSDERVDVRNGVVGRSIKLV